MFRIQPPERNWSHCPATLDPSCPTLDKVSGVHSGGSLGKQGIIVNQGQGQGGKFFLHKVLKKGLVLHFFMEASLLANPSFLTIFSPHGSISHGHLDHNIDPHNK